MSNPSVAWHGEIALTDGNTTAVTAPSNVSGCFDKGYRWWCLCERAFTLTHLPNRRSGPTVRSPSLCRRTPSWCQVCTSWGFLSTRIRCLGPTQYLKCVSCNWSFITRNVCTWLCKFWEFFNGFNKVEVV